MNNDFNIAFTGDSIIARKLPYYNEESVKELIQLIQETDISFTNLEVLPNDFKGYPAARTDGAHFAAPSWVLDEIQDMGFNLFSCANNHALDYGAEGLLATIKELEDRNLSYAGIGRNLVESQMPTYLDVNGANVSMISCSSTFFEEQSAGNQKPDIQGRPGLNPLRFDTVYEVTTEQLNSLKNISKDLGLEQQRQEFIQLGFASEENNPNIFPFLDTNLRTSAPLNAKFREAKTPAVRTEPNENAFKDTSKWIKEAKARSHLTVVSVHAHEQGESREEPAEFVRKFAHRVINEGADIVVGHGPHLLRGMEIYNGKPIFYSLGNFIGQNELIYKLPADSYSRFGINQSLTPSELFSIRSQDGNKGFPADELYWQSVMPICQFENGVLSGIRIVPIGISHGKEAYMRGTPYLAKGDEAKNIIRKFSDLSNEYGTNIIYKEGEGYISML